MSDTTDKLSTRELSAASLTEDAALALLTTRDVTPAQIEEIAHVSHLLNSRKVMLAIARHLRTPRRVSLPLVRQLFVFELMDVALAAAVPADIKLFAEECITAKLSSVTVGERLTLAKRGSTRVAAALVRDADARVRDAALNNPFQTEAFVVRAILKSGATRALTEAIGRHPKWACRVEVRRALQGLEESRRTVVTRKRK
jgi:hypothetical protein